MLCCIGKTFETAPVAVRTAYAFPPHQRRELYARLAPYGGMLVSTCNRTELYTACPADRARDLLSQYCGETPTLIAQGREARRRLFLLASGLCSMLIGEDEILHQLKAAYESARAAGATDGMNSLVQAALACGRRVRAETGISAHACSLATLAANAVLRFTRGQGLVLLVGGTGMVGGAMLKNLLGAGQRVCATERTHAFEDSVRGVAAIPYADRFAALDEADAVIGCTASPHLVFGAAEVARAIETRKPRFFLDLAVPPDMDAAIGGLDGCTLRNIDDLRAEAAQNNAKKQAAAREARGIAEQCLLAFEASEAARSNAARLRAEPALRDLRKRDPAAFLAALDAGTEV